MSTTVELSTPLDAFPLSGIFRASPSAHVEFEPVVHQSGGEVWSFRVHEADSEELDAVLDADEDVRRSRVADTKEDRVLIEVVWEHGSETAPTTRPSEEGTENRIGDGGDSGTERTLLAALGEHDVTVLGLVGTRSGWEFTLRFPDADVTRAFQTASLKAGHSLLVTRVDDSGGDHLGVSADVLTPAQREVFTLAVERGYFAIPRRVTLVDLAEEVGISDQAVSERLRRAQTKLGRAATHAGRP